MKENNNVLIVVENLQKQRLLFNYMVSKFGDNLCTYYNGRADIRIKNKHIKIITQDHNIRGYKYDIVIIDSVLEYNKDLMNECYGCGCDNDFRVIYIDVFDIVEPLIKKEQEEVTTQVSQICSLQYC